MTKTPEETRADLYRLYRALGGKQEMKIKKRQKPGYEWEKGIVREYFWRR